MVEQWAQRAGARAAPTVLCLKAPWVMVIVLQHRVKNRGHKMTQDCNSYAWCPEQKSKTKPVHVALLLVEVDVKSSYCNYKISL